MTYNELRDYIDKFDAAGMVNEPVIKALRAVVELHKPIKYKTVLHVRTGCTCGSAKYPCLTIQAIEKELE